MSASQVRCFVLLCGVALLSGHACAAAAVATTPAVVERPVRPETFGGVDEFIAYLRHLSAYMQAMHRTRPVMPQRFQSVAEYMTYLKDLNAYMTSLRSARIGRDVTHVLHHSTVK